MRVRFNKKELDEIIAYAVCERYADFAKDSIKSISFIHDDYDGGREVCETVDGVEIDLKTTNNQ